MNKEVRAQISLKLKHADTSTLKKGSDQYGKAEYIYFFQWLFSYHKTYYR